MIVFCTTCKNRTQHLQFTLPKNLADNRHGKFVVIDYNSQDSLGIYLQSQHQKDIAGGRLVVYTMLPPDGEPIAFRMSHAKNMAHRCGILEGADILVNLDADQYTGADFDDYIVNKMTDPNTFMNVQMIKGEFPRGVCGRISCTKDQFLKSGGYDEKCDTWWSDDKDFSARLGRMGYVSQLVDRKYLDGIPHSDRMRFKEYPHVATQANEDEIASLLNQDNTIANFGAVGCGTVYRNFDFNNPIELMPIPTRIFGIGMHKTATTSLAKALSILGYDSAHWKSAHWAKAIWREMNNAGRSLTLEQSYALCDLPIMVMYDRLDKAYPGSKFILTVRDENEWLESVRKHWDYNINPFRKAWDEDPFTHIIHTKLYGMKDFDAEVFLARYRRHNAEVAKHFAERREDWLLLHVGSGWRELCRFLKKPVPSVAYPRENDTIIPGKVT